MVVNKIIALSIFILVLTFFLGIRNANACSPRPWSFAILQQQSVAVVYGEVTKSSKDGRRATLKVIQYVGPGVAPQVVHLPPTESSQKIKDDPCSDFSTKFQQGKAYLVFLKQIGPKPALLYSDWITALKVLENNRVNVNMQGQDEEVSHLLMEIANAQLQEVKTPNPDSPSWGIKYNKYMIMMAMLLILVVLGGSLYYLIKRIRIT